MLVDWVSWNLSSLVAEESRRDNWAEMHVGKLSAKLILDFGIARVIIDSNYRIEIILQCKMTLALSLDHA